MANEVGVWWRHGAQDAIDSRRLKRPWSSPILRPTPHAPLPNGRMASRSHADGPRGRQVAVLLHADKGAGAHVETLDLPEVEAGPTVQCTWPVG